MSSAEPLRSPRALLVASGSVAAVKSLETSKVLVASGFSVRVVLTNSAAHFVDVAELEAFLKKWQPDTEKPLRDVYCKKLSSSTKDRGVPGLPAFHEAANVFVDADEWTLFSSLKNNDPVLHIALRDWADILIISPASASFLADAACGRCSDLARSIFRAWPGSKPVVLAPAMNTTMWHHPSTMRALRQIKADREDMAALAWAGIGAEPKIEIPSVAEPRQHHAEPPTAPVAVLPPQLPLLPTMTAAGVTVVVWPVVKTLACGDTGVGALAPPVLIAQAAALACHAAYGSKDAVVQSVQVARGADLVVAFAADGTALPFVKKLP